MRDRHLQFKSWFDLMHAMSSEHDYGVYGQHKLCYCSGVLQAGWWNRYGLPDWVVQPHLECDDLYAMSSGVQDGSNRLNQPGRL